jgi:2,3-bisphosphoglycerate-dependent phosphoglycerate mutase
MTHFALPAGTRVLLLRHAETSAPELFHGAESDVGLGENGFNQAARAADYLKSLKPVAVYSSGMRRARETAMPIARACGLDGPIVVQELHERRMGALSGVPIEIHRPAIVATRQSWQAGDLDATHPGGESYTQIRDRVCPPFQRIAALHRGQTIVVVAHGMVIRVLLTNLVPELGLEGFDKIPIRHVGVNDLRFRADTDTWRAESLDIEPELSDTFDVPG